MDIVKYPDPFLRTPVPAVETLPPDLPDTVRRMFEAMEENCGCGLAAPQVGLPLPLFVMEVNGRRRVVINPVVLEAGDRTSVQPEGCLSIPGLRVEVVRPRRVKVRYQDETGAEHVEQFEGMTGRVFQHETDHLNGILTIDRITPAALAAARPVLDPLETAYHLRA